MFKRFILVYLIFVSASAAMAATSPNFLIILTDDLRFDSFTPEIMPRTWQRIAQEGILFRNAFVTTPLCCPSRASIFTGTLARKHGVMRNKTNSDRVPFAQMNHFPEDLKKNGYFTGLVGKFLNSWKGPWTGRRKDEFNYWAAIHLLDGDYDSYWNFDLYLKKKVVRYRCADPQTGNCTYITDQLARRSSAFLQQAKSSGKPFLLYFAPTAPHGPATPALRHASLFSNLPAFRPPSYAEPDLSDKPNWLQLADWIPKDSTGHPFIDPDAQNYIDLLYVNQLRTLQAVDEAVDSMLEFLKTEGLLDNTFILFTSDNGIYLGEHFLQGKNAPYEESIHVPFAVRFPPLIPIDSPRVNSKHLIANIDIAPTIYELAGLPVPAQTDGKSLVPLLAGKETPWRKSLFFEGWPDRPGDIGDPDQCRPPFRLIRNKRFVYIRYESNTGTGAPCVFTEADGPELYDLRNDPFQLENVAGKPKFHRAQVQLEKRLAKYPKVDAPVRQ